MSASFLRGINVLKVCSRRNYSRGPSSQRFQNDEATKWTRPEGFETGLQIYNLCAKRKVDLVTRCERTVSWYSCGPTVYDSAHIGHASCYVTLDIVRRILQDFFNLKVVTVMGVTDVDDKIIARANELGEDFKTVSRHYEKEFFEDMSKLNVLPPNMVGRVSDYIPEIIDFIQRIIDLGFGYTSDGSVYFQVRKFSRYGKLVPAQEEEEEVGVRSGGEKRSRLDFALWKASKSGEPSWDSPWGKGRPGWHIECSTIASFLLGKCIDIHSGGIDLVFPHHENEEAQSCAYHSTDQWINYWIHTGHLYLKGDVKMSKSLKNTITISDFLRDYTANHLRMFCLLSPYRNGKEYSSETIENAIALNHKLENFLGECNAYIKGQTAIGMIDEPALLKKLNETEKIVAEALSDDFDTPKAVSCLFHLVSMTNQMLRKKSEIADQVTIGRSAFPVAAVSDYIQLVFRKLGLVFKHRDSASENMQLANILDNAIAFRSDVRQVALGMKKGQSEETPQIRKALLEKCDTFREELLSTGVDLKDHGSSTTWNFSSKMNK